MNVTKTALIGAALSAILLAPGMASASFILDTGAPTSTTGGSELTNTEWFAAEFTLSNTESISSLSAYLAPLDSTAYQYDIYSGTGFTTTRATSLVALDQVSATFTTTGWNTTNTSGITLGPGTYWVALEITASAGRGGTGLDLPSTGISTTSGTAPAQAFAYYSTTGGSTFATSSTAAFGIQIAATPVPLPGAAWLLGSAVAGLGLLGRRRAS
jgi:hypothetical protein